VTGSPAPDFFEPVLGWRVWRVEKIRRRRLLVSLNEDVAWAPGVALRARCGRDPRGRLPAHRPPHEECGCGVHALSLDAIDWELLAATSSSPLAIGRVSLWGTVVEGPWGWRAALAYPERLFVPGRGRRGRHRARRLASALTAYRVPVGWLEIEEHADVLSRLARLFPHAATYAPVEAAVH
jgi:hypothetical protein